MLKKHSSIRQKIRLAYVIGFLFVLVIAGSTFINLAVIEERLGFYDVISRFLETTLEIRRFEKNYFLYRKEADLFEALAYIKASEALLQEDKRKFDQGPFVYFEWIPKLFKSGAAGIPPDRISSRTLRLLGEYRELLQKDFTNPSRSDRLAKEIRRKGRELTEIAEGLARSENIKIQRILSTTKKSLVILVLIFLLGAGLIARLMWRLALRPLAELESNMRKIASGDFGTLSVDSRDNEIVSLTNALNKMLQELELRQRYLVRSEKLVSLGTLLSGVAHELNNPLSNISSSSQILAEEIHEADDEYKKELLSQIEEQTDKARKIVLSLLDFSTNKQFKKKVLPLKRLFTETIQFVKGEVPTRVEIVLDVPGDIVIYADKQRIQQALLNLTKNAIEAVNENGSIFIKARKHKAGEQGEGNETGLDRYLRSYGKCACEDDTVDIEIRDTGPGIPPETLGKIFDPFFTTKDVGQGSGLGLFIVFEIIEEHHGCIAVDSKVGEGTTFLIRLPIRE